MKYGTSQNQDIPRQSETKQGKGRNFKAGVAHQNNFA